MVLAALPGADQPEIQDRINELHASEAKLHDDPSTAGMKQLAGRAHATPLPPSRTATLTS